MLKIIDIGNVEEAYPFNIASKTGLTVINGTLRRNLKRMYTKIS
jgi:hypothetical protein